MINLVRCFGNNLLIIHFWEGLMEMFVKVMLEGCVILDN
jgi:hypothetical protein